MRNLNFYINKLSEKKGIRDFLIKQKKEVTEKKKFQEAEIKSLEEAQVFFQTVAQQTQEQLKLHITDIVQAALDSCFPDYTFGVDFGIKRGRTEARIYFIKQGCEMDPTGSSGGGAVDLTSFTLRIVAWSLGRTRNSIIIDEPLKHLSADLQSLAGEIIKELAHKLNLQFIISTHNPNIVNAADRVFTTSIVEDEEGDLITQVKVTDPAE